MEPEEKELLRLLEQYCSLSGLSPATVASKVMNNSRFFDNIYSGKTITIRSYKKARSWLQKNISPFIQQNISSKNLNKKLTSEGNGEFPPISQG